MSTSHCHFAFTRTSVAMAVALVVSSGYALADEVQDLINPNTREISLKVQNLNAATPEFRTYSGLNKGGTTGALEANIVNRTPEGTWTKVNARDIGIKGIQEFGASVEKQGDWRLGIDYNEITKFAPFTVNTKVNGVGTGTLNLNQDFRSLTGLGPETDIKLQRTATSLTGTKLVTDNLKFNLSFKTEGKSGSIMSASNGNSRTGLTPANAGVIAAGKTYATQYFAPQPEDYRHNEISASMDYFTKKFQLTGGYYGSFFNNNNTALNIRPGQSDPAVAGATASSQVPWISLAPSNHVHQLYVSGAYVFSQATRASFKATKAQGIQEAAFIPNSAGGLNPAGVPYAPGITNTNLGGLVDTTSLASRVTSRLTSDLDLTASWRYEDRQDKTPIRQYLTAFRNVQESHKTNNGKLEFGYRLPDDFRLIGGLDLDRKQTPGAMRESVSEQTLRAELRKSMSDSVNGSLVLARGVRNGGTWNTSPADLSGATVSFPTATNVAAPLQFTDRTRDKVKAMLDWSPSNATSLQFFYEYGQDKYTSAPIGPQSGSFPLLAMGMTSGRNDLFGLDAAYALNKDWKLNGYYSYNRNRTHQNELQTPRPASGVQTCAGSGVITAGVLTSSTTCVPWTADLDLNGRVLGAGLKGNVGKWALDAKYLYSKDWTKYNIGITGNNQFSQVPVGSGILPDTMYTLNRLHLAGNYDITKATRVRLDFVYDLRKVQDYAWTGFTFSDGTTVTRPASQKAALLGVTLTHAF